MAQEARKVYLYEHDTDAGQAAIESLGEQISDVAIVAFTHPMHGEVSLVTFSADEKALNDLLATGLFLVDLSVLPTYAHVGEVPSRVIEGAGYLWLNAHEVRVINKEYKPWSANTVLTRFTIEAPNVRVLAEAVEFLQNRILEVSR